MEELAIYNIGRRPPNWERIVIVNILESRDGERFHSFFYQLLFNTWNAYSAHRKYNTIIENLAWIVFRIRGNVPSLPSPDPGGLPSTGLAAPSSIPAQVVQPPPSSGRPLLPLEKLLQFWRLGIGPELELCRR